ncbi:2-hydroxyacid dehydrogenase [Pseudooceanicola nanhaiensis]|uniref:2-hydroxyacid dehydrogenase n=1 Tax=Pseudooceanicola nanhaiensis TaxID=375761 RepID=UPI001CD4C347|nr:glyoxylate/hydroxypyruvate reductase A [Pseudooceanicola nanhaiensis]MCA0920090.1 glyoxylate/hydroxypyruvate reductase A [Pseudooceanicola nanhaiensis]
MPRILFAAGDSRWPTYEAPLKAALAEKGIEAEIALEMAPETVDYIIYAPGSPLQDFTPFTNCKAVMNIWAGVEAIVGNPTLTQPLTRMVDHGLKQGMLEWVVGQVMRHHLGLDIHITTQDGVWRHDTTVPPLAEDRPVTMLGLGELGMAAGEALARIGFPVTGWSRSPKESDLITTLHGAEGLKQALSTAQIVVLLVPFTPQTENLLNAETLALLPEGAVILNPGRGPLIDDSALLAALDSGQVSHATLDVFRTEPLPEDHAYWAHPKVTVSPHIASETRASTAAQVLAENIRRGEAGEPFRFQVDRSRGY